MTQIDEIEPKAGIFTFESKAFMPLDATDQDAKKALDDMERKAGKMKGFRRVFTHRRVHTVTFAEVRIVFERIDAKGGK